MVSAVSHPLATRYPRCVLGPRRRPGRRWRGAHGRAGRRARRGSGARPFARRRRRPIVPGPARRSGGRREAPRAARAHRADPGPTVAAGVPGRPVGDVGSSSSRGCASATANGLAAGRVTAMPEAGWAWVRMGGPLRRRSDEGRKIRVGVGHHRCAERNRSRGRPPSRVAPSGRGRQDHRGAVRSDVDSRSGRR